MMGRVRSWMQRNDFARNVLVLMSGTAMAQLVGIVSLFVLPHFYSQADIGIYSVYNSLLLSLIAIAALRYDFAIVLPDNHQEAQLLARLCMRIVIGVCAVITIACVLFREPLSAALGAPSLQFWLLPLGLNLLLVGWTQVFGMWLTRTREYGVISRNRMVQSVSMGALQIGLPFVGVGGVTGLVVGTFAGQLLATLGLWRTVRPALVLNKRAGGGSPDAPALPGSPAAVAPAEPRDLLRQYRKMPLVNGPNVLVDFARTNGINFLILRFFGEALLGQFAWALRITQAPLGLINGAIGQVFFQKLAVTERGHMLALVSKASIRSLLLGLVPFGLLFVLSPWFFEVAMPPEWSELGIYVQSLTPWLYLNLVTSPISNLFLVLHRQASMLAFSVIYAVTPLVTIWFVHDDLLQTVRWISGEMAVILVGFVLLALWESRRFDRGR
ncbi:oligosaccharide flippase family protein [Micrococcales bacterium 31B]|nr:oligosaccharide flippase family protein [Micrococcales bacterium 31B]